MHTTWELNQANDIVCNIMKRFVFDTDTIVAAMRSPSGASAALLSMVLKQRITMLASVPLFFEYEAKCTLRAHWQAAGLTAVEASIFVNGLAAIIKPVETHFLWRPRLRDADDEMVLEAAVNGQAEAIITFNTRDYQDSPKQFNIEVLTPAMAIRRVKDE